MKKQEFIEYVNKSGYDPDRINVNFGIYITDKEECYVMCDRGVCRKGDRWIRYTMDERGHITIFGEYDEDECFDRMKEIFDERKKEDYYRLE